MEKAGNVNSYSLMDSNVFHPDLGNSSTRWHRKYRQPHMHYIGYGISGPKNKIKLKNNISGLWTGKWE